MDKDTIYQGSVSPAQYDAKLTTSVDGTNPIGALNLLRLILRRWIAVFLIVLFAIGGGFFYIHKVPRTFEAYAEIEMSIRRPRVTNNEAVFDEGGVIRDDEVIFNTRFAKFRSPAMERLATQEYFKRYPGDQVSETGKGIGKYMLASLVREVEWHRDPKANIVHVSYRNSNGEFAAKLVNVLVHCSGLLMIQENQSVSDEAVKWLVVQVDEQRNDLEEVELQLAGLREELQLDSLQQRKAALGQSTITITAEREQVISTLEARKTVYSFVLELKETDPNLEMLPTGLPKEDQLNELIRTWRAAHEELLLVSGRYTELHPEYRNAAEVESRAKKRLEQFIEMSAKSVQNEIDLLNKQLERVDQRIKDMERDAVGLELELGMGMQRLLRLERERDAADQSYQAMLRRMEEARLSADENTAYTKIIRSAEVPRIPVSPRKVEVLAISGVLGFFIGCFVVILAAFLTDKIEAITDLREMGLNVLGTIPTYKKAGSRNGLATICLREKFCTMVEVFAGVNALISSDKYADCSKVILINSSMPSEGKTVSACNLAISSALNGVKTLLIDGDLRRPQLVGIFEIDSAHPSLLEWLNSEHSGITHEKLVTHGVVENLDVITSRPVQDINPAELLGRRQLAELISWARHHYDRVIIDSPPLGPVGDAQVLVNHVDSVIMVSRVGKTRRRSLRFALARYKEVDAFVLGCVANDVPHSLAGMFGGAEGYGYGYGYKSYGNSK